MTKLGSSLPKGEANGMQALARQLIDEPEKVHVVVMLVDCKKITTDVDNGDVDATWVERVVIPLVTDADELARMRAAAGSRGHADGAARLVDLVEDAAATGGRA